MGEGSGPGLQILPTGASSVSPAGVGSAQRAEQLAQSNLHRATCAERPVSDLRRAPRLAQSDLQGALARATWATCAEQLDRSSAQKTNSGKPRRPQAECPLRATCAEQLAQSNLRRASCAEQIALRRAISKSACASRR